MSTEQVGDQLVDLQSRLQSQRASVERVRALLADAKDLAQIVQIEASSPGAPPTWSRCRPGWPLCRVAST